MEIDGSMKCIASSKLAVVDSGTSALLIPTGFYRK